MSGGWRTIYIERNHEGTLVPQVGTTGYSAVDLPRPAGCVTEAIGPPLDASAMMFDVDHYGDKHGAETLADLEHRLGPLPPTVKITSRGPNDPGGKLPYRIPAGTRLAESKCGKDIELVQAHHRFTWAPETIHPKTETLVKVYDRAGNLCVLPDVVSLPLLPQAWLEHLRADDRATVPGDADLPTDDGRCPVIAKGLAKTDFTGATARGKRAALGVTYLKRADAEGHKIGGLLGDLLAVLPGGAEGMWDQPVPADCAETWHGCCDEMIEGAGVISNWKITNKDLPTQTPAVVPPGGLLARLKNGAYLSATEFPPLYYHIDGLLPEGLTLLVGAPKIGKSWLVLGWLLDQARKGRPVFYLALEDSDRRMKSRCSLLGADIPEKFTYMTEEDVVPGALMATIEAFVLSNHSSRPLVVLDTLGKAQAHTPRLRDETNYDRDYRIMSSLQLTVRSCPGAALVVCHHDRKAVSEDFLDAASGTRGVTGGPDTIMVLLRPRLEAEGSLMMTGRDVEENAFALTYRSYRWTFDGGTPKAAAVAYIKRKVDAKNEKLGDRSGSIVEYAHEAGESGIKAADAADVAGMTQNAATEYLRRLEKSGRLRKTGRGTYVCVCGVCVATPPSSETPIQTHTQHTKSLAYAPARARESSSQAAELTPEEQARLRELTGESA